MEDTQIKIELTGNPFVDTGLAVIASLANLDDINELKLSHLKNVFGDGTQLADTNARLKIFNQICGRNNPLLQNSYGFKKSTGPSERNKAIYINTLNNLLDEIGNTTKGQKCWACGNSTNLNFSQICKKAIEKANESERDTTYKKAIFHEKRIGREWFPLAGSLGSDAQALPAASQSPILCPKCLFSIHYLPQGLILLDGRSVLFQSTSIEFWYALIRDIVNEIKSRIQAGNTEVLGKGEGSRELMRRLLPLFERLQASHRQGIPKGTSLCIWKFSNSGQNPECIIEEVPNPALLFLQNAVAANLRSELEMMIKFERGNPQNSLYHCISNKWDYPYLYPDGKKPGASIKLFMLYQMNVRGHSITSLKTAYNLSKFIANHAKKKDLKQIQNSKAFFDAKNRLKVKRNRVLVRHMIVQMTDNGELNHSDYLDMFPLNVGSGISVGFEGWNFIRFFINRTSEEFPDIQDAGVKREQPVNPVPYYAAKIYNNHLQERGKDRFQKEVINRMGRGTDISWLKNQFVHLAESENGFTYENWNNLCKQDNQSVFISELMFQMRLLWIQWIREDQTMVNFSQPIVSGDNGIPEKINRTLEMIAKNYIEQRGDSRYYQDILVKIRKKELGMAWIRRKFTESSVLNNEPITEQEWDDFLIDDEGNDVKNERFFQIQLAFANIYRMRVYNGESWKGIV
ncbi:MAG: hypothetical protein WAU64_07565 [Methanoregula sp.]|uniref:hypothetical protein n=1 Tax=Methanoregula sp. TaxID=2052170 RepID=UPI003BB12060